MFWQFAVISIMELCRKGSAGGKVVQLAFSPGPAAFSHRDKAECKHTWYIPRVCKVVGRVERRREGEQEDQLITSSILACGRRIIVCVALSSVNQKAELLSCRKAIWL